MQPDGTLTFLFTDVEGSTRAWVRNPGTMGAALARHDALIERLVADHHGQIVRPRGEGDSRFAVFVRASDAAAAAYAVQLALMNETWALDEPLRVRMAIHTGEADLRMGDYYGPAVNHCARLRAAAHGGQVLVSAVTADVLREAPPSEFSLRNLGLHQLKDIDRPEQVCQLLHPKLCADFPPLVSMSVQRHNLPNQLSSFVGRDQAIDELRRMLATRSLVSLTGPGGIGKTRLALRMAADMLAGYPDGIFLVTLAPLTAPNQVVPAIARTLGVRDQSGGPLLPQVVNALQGKKLLLLLDNFEHVLPAAASVAELLIGCPALKVLATSRAALRIDGEQEVPLAPMNTPEQPWPDLEELMRYEAVQLFIERARQVAPDFQVTPEIGAHVAEICARVDGLPLAIELAAARVKLLPPQALLSRLDQRLSLLVGGARDRPLRQQTLRATIDWSYHLLNAEQQAVFRKLGAFAGGCTLAAAEAVCSAADVLDNLGELVDQSLLRQDTGTDGEPRLRMLETVREYAPEQLTRHGEGLATQCAHAEYFTALGEQADLELVAGSDRSRWLRRLELEEDNLFAAMRWCVDAGEIERGLRLGVGAARYWSIQGSLNDGREWQQSLLRLASRGGDRGLRASALNAAGALALYRGDYAGASALHQEVLGIGRDLGDRTLIFSAQHNLGLLAVRRGDYELALTLFEEVAAAHRASGDRRRELVVLNLVAGALARKCDYGAARAHHAESLILARELGDKTAMADALSRQGFAALAEGDVADAQSLCEEAVKLAREDANKGSIAWCCLDLALVRLNQQEYAGARAACFESMRLRDDTDEAQARLALGMEVLASIAAETGQPIRALHLFEAATTLPATRGTRFFVFERMLRDRWLPLAANALEEPAVSAAIAEGRSLTPESAVAYAFNDAGPDSADDA